MRAITQWHSLAPFSERYGGRIDTIILFKFMLQHTVIDIHSINVLIIWRQSDKLQVVAYKASGFKCLLFLSIPQLQLSIQRSPQRTLTRPSSEPHGATRKQAIAKTPAKLSAYQFPSVIFVFVVLVFKV
jgi:hypothetical protein